MAYGEPCITLGRLIEILKSRDPAEVWSPGLGEPQSYRGYYEDLAFDPVESATVKSMLEFAQDALGKTYTGYKGGEFRMNEHTSVWVASWGTTRDGRPIVEGEQDVFMVPEAGVKA